MSSTLVQSLWKGRPSGPRYLQQTVSWLIPPTGLAAPWQRQGGETGRRIAPPELSGIPWEIAGTDICKRFPGEKISGWGTGRLVATSLSRC